MAIRDGDNQPVYQWDKAQHHDFDALLCPPWDLTEQPARHGLFPHPPLASSIVGRVCSAQRVAHIQAASWQQLLQRLNEQCFCRPWDSRSS